MTMSNEDRRQEERSEAEDQASQQGPGAEGDRAELSEEARRAAEGEQNPPEGEPEAEAEAEAEAEESPMEALQRERDELLARLQRVSADYQNYMKRAEQHRANDVDMAKGDAMKDLVPVLDQFDRALEAEPSGDEAKGLYEGMRMVREEMLKILEQIGVRRIDPEPGDRFDPHIHEAMMRQPAEGIDPNHVAQPFVPGYVYKHRTLRPAKVAVVPEDEGGEGGG